MRTIFIFHGTGAGPEWNWFPWMKAELEKLGCQVFVPKFPTPEGESLDAWLAVFNNYKKYLNKESILIGHSKGGLFLLRLLERLEKPVHAAFFVGAPIGIPPIKYMVHDEKFAIGFSFDWQKIKSNAQKIFVYHSDNDPYVCLANGQELAKHLGVNLTFIPNAGHLNAESGYTKFPQLRQQLEKLL